MQALPGTLACGCCDCRCGHNRWALRTRLTCSVRLRISAGTHMRTENEAAFEKNCFFLLKVLQSEYTEYKVRKAPMPRPPRCRRIFGVPQVDTFCPNGCGNTEPILLTQIGAYAGHVTGGERRLYVRHKGAHGRPYRTGYAKG